MLPKTTLQLVQFLVCKDCIPDGFFLIAVQNYYWLFGLR